MIEPDPELLARYLAGLTNPKESAKVFAWLEENPVVRMKLEGSADARPALSTALDDLRARRIELDHVDTARTEPRTDREPSRTPVRGLIPVRSRNPFSKPFRIAAMIAIASILGTLLWTSSQKSMTEPSSVAYQTAPGERLRLTLPDGSSVQLNVDSRLIVSSDFGVDDRRVELEGQGFFDVKSDTSLPFLITASSTQVRVVGTEFDIQAYEDQSDVEIVVSEGRVEFSDLTEPTSVATLSRGDMGRIDRSLVGGAGITVTQPDSSQWPAWQRGKLIFAGTTVTEIARTLNRWYNVEVTIVDKSIANRRLDASFDNEGLDVVLGTIERSLNVPIAMSNDEVTIGNIVER